MKGMNVNSGILCFSRLKHLTEKLFLFGKTQYPHGLLYIMDSEKLKSIIVDQRESMEDLL
ncbi:hypothetical protein SUSAZ_08985 [Sulfolobus acidocaldarius SUSAZ]|nr:hypothetical protein SUSAZ_08985 [Sulfolobus acidocaldarius SUSAZ]